MLEVKELIKATKARLAGRSREIRVKGICIDSRVIKPQEAFLAIRGNNFNGHDFIEEAVERKAACIISESQVKIKKPGVAYLEVKDTVRALGEIAGVWRKKFVIPVIAITGSNGKTTTKEMLAWVLSWKFKVLKNEGTKNNRIGVPLTLLRLNKSHEIAIVELGTSHFGEIGYLAGICLANLGVITNIGPSHLEFFHSLGGVLKEKYALIRKLQKPKIAVLNADDGLLGKKLREGCGPEVKFGFGMRKESDFFATDVKEAGRVLEFLVNQKYKFTLPALGYYNIYNALAAIAVGRIFSLQYEDMAKRLAAFTIPTGRLNLIELNGIRFIDDTYNANPLSLGAALDVLGNLKTRGRKILVMGDMLELGSRSRFFHRKAGTELAGICDVFVGVGKMTRLAAERAREAGLERGNIFTCNSSLEARDILYKIILPKKEDVVLVKGSRSMRMEEVLKK